MTLALNFLGNDKTLKGEVDKFYKEDDEGDNILSAISKYNAKVVTGSFDG